MNKIKSAVLACVLLFILVACGGTSNAVLSSAGSAAVAQAAAGTGTSTETGAAAATATPSALVAEDSLDHEEAEAEVVSSAAATSIVLEGDSVTVSGAGATAAGSVVTITSAGTYSVQGSLEDGQLIVDTQDEGTVGIILEGADISSSIGPALHIVSAQEAVIVLADSTENRLSDGGSRAAEGSEDVPNAAIFSMADLTLSGGGSLAVEGNYKDGIAGKDGLLIAGGRIAVEAADDGIRGKDYLIVQGGTIRVDAQGDGLKADNEVDATRGYITIQAGVIEVTSGGDAIAAETTIAIADGTLTLTAGGGSSSRIDAGASAKGIKAAVSVVIDGGSFQIDSADDAIHSNGALTINGGTFLLSTGDDAMHADSTLEINGGEITIDESYEGLESAQITIRAGDIYVTASDDGINVAGGIDASGMMAGPGQGGPRGGRGQDTFAATSSQSLAIHGGTIVVAAYGDGIDVNGSVEMTDGVLLVSGPTEQMNGALDYDAGFTMTGGLLVAAGSAGMAQAPDQSSGQASLLLYFSSTQKAGSLVHIENAEGEEIVTFSPAHDYQSLAFSSPGLLSGTAYQVYTGGSSTGSTTGGLYQGGSYSGGREYTSFTVTGTVTWVGGRAR